MRAQLRTADGALAKGLGWFSIGLGVAEPAAPASVAQLIGRAGRRPGRVTCCGLYGAREIANGTAILGSGADDPEWLWTRVAGDVLDLATMGAALRDRERTDTRKLAIGMASVAGVLIADVMAARRVGRENGRANVAQMQPRQRTSIRVSKTFTINAPPDEVYTFWRQLDNLPRFMRHLESVEPLGGRITRGRVRSRRHARRVGRGDDRGHAAADFVAIARPRGRAQQRHRRIPASARRSRHRTARQAAGTTRPAGKRANGSQSSSAKNRVSSSTRIFGA